jgi:hypothetical protein
MAEYDHCVVDSVIVYDTMGQVMNVGPLFTIYMPYVADWVDGWVEKNSESLQYDACEMAGEIERGLQEEAAEYRFQSMRDGD